MLIMFNFVIMIVVLNNSSNNNNNRYTDIEISPNTDI